MKKVILVVAALAAGGGYAAYMLGHKGMAAGQTGIGGFDDLSAEPKQEISQFLNKKLTNCHDDGFILVGRTETWGGGASSFREYFDQYKGLTVDVEVTPLTDADRLNGLEWNGTVELSADTSRRYGFRAVGPQGWDRWENGGGETYTIRKRKGGNWVAVAPNGYTMKIDTDIYAHPSCDVLKGAFLPHQ
jgi:hypothetical protein